MMRGGIKERAIRKFQLGGEKRRETEVVRRASFTSGLDVKEINADRLVRIYSENYE